MRERDGHREAATLRSLLRLKMVASHRQVALGWPCYAAAVDHPAISAVAPPFARCRVRFRLRPCSAPLVRAQRIVATSRGLANFLYRRLPFLSGGQYSAQRRALMYALDGPRCTPPPLTTSRLLCSTHTCTAKTNRGDKIITSLPTGKPFCLSLVKRRLMRVKCHKKGGKMSLQ